MQEVMGKMKEALFAEYGREKAEVLCTLCPNDCLIKEDAAGRCRVRHNVRGKLYTVIDDRCCSVNLDPIEKKPLYHYYPGSSILSLGTFGCNFSCLFCQNWTLSHADSKDLTPEGIRKVAKRITPDDALQYALDTRDRGNIGIAYTYNEPSIWYEFVFETAQLIKKHQMKNILVSNGYMKEKPLRALLPYIDAINIDIKSINPEFYKIYCKARLEPVLDFCKIAREQVLLEITNLVIPTLNDSDEDLQGLVDWIATNLGSDVPIHFSRYHPDFKLDLPATPPATLERAHEIAVKKLKYVYVGNIAKTTWDHTFCPGCSRAVIEREYMGVTKCHLTEDNRCSFCQEKIAIAGTCRQSW
jgi:pyruvate formate lyase activating enzyme